MDPMEAAGWRPIESAPRSDDVILVYSPTDGFGVMAVSFDANASHPSHPWECHPDGPHYAAEAFTHWMPLPKPPTKDDVPTSDELVRLLRKVADETYWMLAFNWQSHTFREPSGPFDMGIFAPEVRMMMTLPTQRVFDALTAYDEACRRAHNKYVKGEKP